MLMRLTPQFAALFTAGIVAAGILVASDRMRRLPWHWLALIAVVPVVLVIGARGSEWTVGNFMWVDLALGPATALLLAAVAVGRPSPFVRLLETQAAAAARRMLLQPVPHALADRGDRPPRRATPRRRARDADLPRHACDRRAARRRLRAVVRVALRDPVPAASELGCLAERDLRPVE